MTNAALRGKPDAGNPHVRFDEGEVTLAATPRRGSLLCKCQAKLPLGLLLGLGLSFAAFAVDTKFYVATYGDDSNAGTSWDCPFRTIEKGVAAVKTGSGEKELIISNGTYALSQTIENPSSGSVAMRSLTGDPKDASLTRLSPDCATATA